MSKPRPIARRLHIARTVERDQATSQVEDNAQFEPKIKQRRVEELSNTDEFGVLNLKYDNNTLIQDASITEKIS